ncbi:MAG: DUF1631 family protein [Gammaproteobacteria bacterium]|nr:DUF1631 family protein [Gammaproteobacteria bacterium]
MSKPGPQPKQVMQRLGEKYPGTDTAEPATNEALLAALAAVSAAENSRAPLLERMQPTDDLSATRIVPGRKQAAVLAWVDDAFRIMLSEHSLDDELTGKVKKLLPVVAAVALVKEEFLSIGQHPLQRLVDTIYTGCLGWHSRLGRAGEALQAELDRIVTGVQRYFESPEQDFSDLLSQLEEFIGAELSASERMRKRVIASEQGKLKASSARVTAGMALNELMENQEFSVPILEFLIGPWFDSMQLTLITEGPDSKEWERMLKVTKTLVWTVQPFDSSDENERQRLYKLIPLMPRELGGLLTSLKNDPTERKQAIAVVEDMHFRLLRNRPPKFKPYEPILLGSANARTSVTERLLAQIKPLQPGQWFKISTEDGPNLRVQLALKMDEYHQLLFVNRAGIKALQKTFEEFAYLLSSGVARPCPAAPALSISLLKALDMEAEASAGSAKVAAPAQTGKKKPGLSPRVQELIKQRAKAAGESEPSNLVIGSWVKFSDGDEPQLCKLAARIDGLDKWLFVNNRGVKQRELNSAELSALQESGHCELVTSESRFEQTVANMVRDFRNHHGEED